MVFYNPAQVSSLGNTDHQLNSNSISVYQDQGDMLVQSNYAPLKMVAVYNLNGQVIYQNNNVNDVRLNISGLNTNYQAVFIKAVTADGIPVTKNFWRYDNRIDQNHIIIQTQSTIYLNR